MNTDGVERGLDAQSDADKAFAERDAQTFDIIGAAMEVHKQLGGGFLEPVYQEALAVELSLANVPFTREVPVPVHYKNVRLACSYRADFICFGQVLVELKAISKLSNVEISQVVNYLKATRLRRGLHLNFGADRLEVKRVVA